RPSATSARSIASLESRSRRATGIPSPPSPRCWVTADSRWISKALQGTSHMARILLLALLSALSLQAQSDDDSLWKRLKDESNLIVLMRHAQPAGGNPLVWDESGNCAGEPMLTDSGKAHARRI